MLAAAASTITPTKKLVDRTLRPAGLAINPARKLTASEKNQRGHSVPNDALDGKVPRDTGRAS